MFCPNCGTKLEDGAVFCTSCGVRIAQDTPTPVQSEQPADSAQQPLQSEAPVQQPAPAEQPDIWHQAANDAPEDTWQQPAQDQQPPFEQPIVTNTVPGGAASLRRGDQPRRGHDDAARARVWREAGRHFRDHV